MAEEAVEDHMRECLKMLAWDQVWEEKSCRYSSYVFYLVAVFLLEKIILFLEGVRSGCWEVGDEEEWSFVSVIEQLGNRTSIFVFFFFCFYTIFSVIFKIKEAILESQIHFCGVKIH